MRRLRMLVAGTVALALCASSGGLVLAESDDPESEAAPGATIDDAPLPSIDPSFVPDADAFIYENIAPGVRRLITDGAGHFPSATYIREARDMDELAADDEGRVLVWSTTHGIDNELGGDAQLWILGVEGILDPDEGSPRPSDSATTWSGPAVQLAPDGSTWSLNGGYDGSGVIRSDGEITERFLANRFLNSLAVTPDGRAWVAEGHDSGEAGGIYVIEPDAQGDPVEAGLVSVSMPTASSASAPIPIERVTLVGEPFFVRANDEPDMRRCSGEVVEADTVADGEFLPESQCWDEGAVWWEDANGFWSGDTGATPDRWIELDLGGTYRLDGAIVQADDNDAYLLSYRELESDSWSPLWLVPPAWAFGMITRPVSHDTSLMQALPIAVTTDALRFEADSGDGMYSVSEIQLFGEPAVGSAGGSDGVTMTAPTGAESGALELAWAEALQVPGPFVVEAVVAAHDRFYALANDRVAGYYSPSALWTSDDGTEWVELDVAELLSDDASVRRLVASERGLLALGFRPTPDGHAATAWFSADGVSWDASELGYVVEPATQPYTTSLLDFSAAALGSTGAVATAAAVPGFDWEAAKLAAAAALPPELAGIDPDRVNTTVSSVQVSVGPFVVYSESLEALGLGEVAEAQRLTNSPSSGSPEQPMTFQSGDLDEWSVVDGNPMEADYVMAIIPVGDEYVAAAYGRSGRADVLASSDGHRWESTGEVMEGTSGLFKLGDRVLTDGWQGSQRVTMASDDSGRTWEEVPGPDVAASWISAAGPAGILATGTAEDMGWGPSAPGVVERDGYTVTFDSMGQEFTVADQSGSELVSSALQMDDPMWGMGYTAPDELVFDFEDETAAVLDPSTGETLFTLTFDDLDRLGASMISYGGELLLFSPDAERWTIDTLDDAFGPESVLAASAVGSDRVVAAVGSGYPDPYADQSIWVGLPVAGEAVPTAEVGEEPPEVVMGGPALAWEQVLDLEEREFSSMLAADSGMWAIEGERYEPSILWQSTDGATWTPLDTAALLGEGAIVRELAEAGPGLLAVGSVPSGGDREAMAWTSADGQEWTRTPLGYAIPGPERSFEVADLMVQAVAAGPSGAVIAATPLSGIDYGLLEPNVASALPVGLRDFASGMGVMIDPWQVSASVGPFAVFSAAVSDLDVDQELFQAYGRGVSGGTGDLLFFATDDFADWQQVEGWPGGNAQPSAMTATGDGYLAATWAWGGSPGLYASADGITWEEAELPAGVAMVRWLGSDDERLLMVGETGGQTAVWESSDDGSTWTAWAGVPADTWDVEAGPLGLLATGEHPSEWWDRSQKAPTVIERDGYTLTIDDGPGGCTVTGVDGEVLLTADCYGTNDGSSGVALPPFIVADHDQGVFTVTDPESGNPLMTITYREMQDAYELAQGPAGLGPDNFVAYSADGRTWSQQSISQLTGTASWIGPFAVSDDFAVMMLSELDGPASLWQASGG